MFSLLSCLNLGVHSTRKQALQTCFTSQSTGLSALHACPIFTKGRAKNPPDAPRNAALSGRTFATQPPMPRTESGQPLAAKADSPVAVDFASREYRSLEMALAGVLPGPPLLARPKKPGKHLGVTAK
jgi:hypothetical protein